MAASSELAKPVTVRSFRRAEGGWPVAHRGNAPAGRMHRLDQPDGLAILGQIPQGSRPLILDPFDYQGVDTLDASSVVLLLRIRTVASKQ